jgi:hypothetical protein
VVQDYKKNENGRGYGQGEKERKGEYIIPFHGAG